MKTDRSTGLAKVLKLALGPCLALAFSLSASAQSRDEDLENVMLSQDAWCADDGEGRAYRISFNEDGSGTFNGEESEWFTGYQKLVYIDYPSAPFPGRVSATVNLISYTDMIWTWRRDGVVSRFTPCQ